MHSLRPRFLVLLGMIVMALGTYLRQLSTRTSHATDLSDFTLGTLAGIGIGIMLLGIWRSHHNNQRPRTR